jgi:hypothetical protein
MSEASEASASVRFVTTGASADGGGGGSGGGSGGIARGRGHVGQNDERAVLLGHVSECGPERDVGSERSGSVGGLDVLLIAVVGELGGGRWLVRQLDNELLVEEKDGLFAEESTSDVEIETTERGIATPDTVALRVWGLDNAAIGKEMDRGGDGLSALATERINQRIGQGTFENNKSILVKSSDVRRGEERRQDDAHLGGRGLRVAKVTAINFNLARISDRFGAHHAIADTRPLPARRRGDAANPEFEFKARRILHSNRSAPNWKLRRVRPQRQRRGCAPVA